MKRTLIAGLLGGVIAFVWGAIAHMNPLTSQLGLSVMNEKEDAVLAALKSNLQQPGLYFFPGMDMTKAMTDKAQGDWAAQIPLGRLGTTADVAAAVCFLASDEASYITGQVLAVNGGMYM